MDSVRDSDSSKVGSNASCQFNALSDDRWYHWPWFASAQLAIVVKIQLINMELLRIFS